MKNPKSRFLLAAVAAAVLVGLIVTVSGPVLGVARFGRTPQGWDRSDRLDAGNGVRGYLYTGAGTLADAMEVFSGEMTRAGWEPEGEASFLEGFAVAVLRKGKSQAVLLAIEGEGDAVTVSVLTGKRREEPPKTLAPPTADTAGEDPLPRFPGSVRAAYETAGGETAVDYLTASPVETVVDFFLEEFSSETWVFDAMEEREGASGRTETVITASVPGETLVLVTVTPDPYNLGLTLIQVWVLEFD